MLPVPAGKSREKEEDMSTYKEGFKIIKPFTFESKTICDIEKQGKAALIIDTEEETINVDIISGPAPYAEDIMFFLLGDKDVRLLIKKYQQNGHRKYKFNLRTSSGFSGREDVYINYYTDYGLQIKGKKLLHISQYEKLNEGWIEM